VESLADSLARKLQNEAVTASALDLLGERELRKVLISLVEYGVRPLLLKGASLAYTVYPSPALRPRGDTDLLVREGDLPRVAQILRKLGYVSTWALFASNRILIWAHPKS
jgi:hypothetical protein